MALKFTTRLARAAKAVLAAGVNLFSGAGGQGGRGWRRFLPGSQYDYEAEAGDLWRNSAAAACLRVIRTNFPEPSLEIAAPDPEGDGDDLAKVPGHGLVTLVDRPNDFYSHYELWAATSLSLVVDGNAFWLKVRSPAGKVVQLWWVPHWTIEPRWPADGSQFIACYAYTVNGKTWYLGPDDVVHFRTGIDPHNTRLGLSDLKAAVREICSDNEAAGYSASILRNSGVPTVVITPAEAGGVLGDGQADKIRAQWRQRFTGEGRGDPLVTDTMQVAKLGFSPKEMGLGDLPDRFEDRICALTGVNPMVAGLTSGGAHKTYANYAEARRAFYEDTLIPLQKLVARTLTLQLLSDFLAPLGAVVRWCYKGVACLRENENDLATRAGVLYFDKKLITLNEGRKAIGHPPTKGGDKFADGSTPDEGPSKPAPPPAVAGDGASEEADPEEAKRLRAEAVEVLALARKRLESQA